MTALYASYPLRFTPPYAPCTSVRSLLVWSFKVKERRLACVRSISLELCIYEVMRGGRGLKPLASPVTNTTFKEAKTEPPLDEAAIKPLEKGKYHETDASAIRS